MELLTDDSLLPMGKYVVLTHYFDANIYHGKLVVCSIVGVIIFSKKAPVDWYSNKQSTVETAKYGSDIFFPYLCRVDYWF